MRKSNEEKFLFDDNKKLIGISLGSNFCAEHEKGIEDIKFEFGIRQEEDSYSWLSFAKVFIGQGGPVFGIEKRTITKVPECLVTFDSTIVGESGETSKKFSQDITTIGMGYSWQSPEKNSEYLGKLIQHEHYYDANKELYAWWSWKDFMFSSHRKDYMKDIFEAFINKDIAMWFGSNSSNPFGGATLVIAIKSRIPEDILKTMYDGDESHYKLLKEVEKTDIEKKLKAAGKTYHALSPSRPSDKNKKESKHNIIFWLNPRGQQENNHGWYTVEELEEWIENKGPIPIIKTQI